MTTTTPTATTSNSDIAPGASFLPWISRGLEGLWLLAVFLVPLMFLGQDYAISEAKIAYVEVPKVALLRLLAGLIALIWAIEWAIKSRAFQDPLPSISIQNLARNLHPYRVLLGCNNWLRVHPTRWLLLAAGLFFGSTFLSTVLSGSFTTSMWGEIPGQDGYSAYSVASYGVLFAVIATHLKNQAQLGRLLGAVILMGVLVGLYGTLQHYHHDFLGITETSGGGSARVTIFMGNTIFAGAVLAMTVPLTLVAAAIHLQNENWRNRGLLSKLGHLGTDSVFTSLWASILAVQLLGLMFTFSRGPWSGAVLALVIFLGLVVLSFGWRILIRTGLVLGLAGILSVAFLHWQGNVSIIDVGGWLGIVLALLGLAGTVAILFVINKFGRAAVFVAAAGVAIVVAGGAILAPSALSDRGNAGSTGATAGVESITGGVVERIASVRTEVLGGLVGGRATHWKVSWELIKNRPWFEFDDLSLNWLRFLIGYGPDLFRYTYLLESQPEAQDLRPLEPDHAHNMLIHQTVEQGIFGGLAFLALFASVFGVAAHHMLRRRQSGDPVYRLLLLGLMAIIVGRFLEMMVGVARVSDLTVLWVILGLFASLLIFDAPRQDEAAPAVRQTTQIVGRRNRRRAARAARASGARSFSTGLMFRLAMVAWLAGLIGVVTWQKSINSVRAAVAEGRALEHFQSGNLGLTVSELDKAIKLAPGVPNYYNNRAQVFLAYQIRPEVFTEPSCDRQIQVPYLNCLGIQSFNSNSDSVNHQKFNYRAWLAKGNSAFNLRLNDIAIESYTNAMSMVPYAWDIKNDLAESQIDIGLYDEALAVLDLSLSITGESGRSTRAFYFKGRALRELGRFDEALDSLKKGIFLDYDSRFAQASLALIVEINAEQGVRSDVAYFDRQISQDPRDPIAYFLRGMAHLTLGNAEKAKPDFETSIDLGLLLPETRARRGYTRFKSGESDGIAELAVVVKSAPQNALYQAYFGEAQLSQRNYAEALNYLENANVLDPDLGLAYLIRGKIYMSLGLQESAEQVFDSSVGLELPTAQDYVDRGEIYAFFGKFDLAFADFEEAIRINPNQAKFYDARAKTYASTGEFESALADFDAAIRLSPSTSEYFINRGVTYHLIGDPVSSLADFEIARSLGEVEIPLPADRNPSYFAVYTDTTPTEAEARQLLTLQATTQALRDIEYNSAIRPNHADYPDALKILGETYLELELWGEAIKSLSLLIDLSPGADESYRYRGDAYLALERYDDAIDDYFQAMGLGNLDSANVLARGRAYAEIGRFDLARSDFNVAIGLDPDSSGLYSARGYLSVQSENYSMAFSDLNRAIEIAPLNHDAYFKRASAHIGLGQTSLALEDLAQAITLAPTNSDYRYSRGKLRLELEEYDLALADFDAAIGLKQSYSYIDPRHARPLVDRGKEYLRLGYLDKSIVDAQMAIERLENNFGSSEWDNRRPAINLQLADAYQLLGDAYTKLGNPEEAKEEYQKASELR